MQREQKGRDMGDKSTRLGALALAIVIGMTGCDSTSSTVDEENLAETTGNPCLESWAITGIKEHIKERAIELIVNEYGEGALDASWINNADIAFDYISQPTELDNGDLSCSANVSVNYIGSKRSEHDLVSRYVKLLNTDIPFDSNPFANEYSGYNLRAALTSFGVNEFMLGEFQTLSGNQFTINMDYDLRSTYSENGDAQQSYQAAIGAPAAMLASIYVFDKLIQKNKADTAQRAEEMAAAELAGYSEEDYVDAVDGVQDDMRDDEDEVVLEPKPRVEIQQAAPREPKPEPQYEPRPNPNLNEDPAIVDEEGDPFDEDRYDTTYDDGSNGEVLEQQ